jgi:uncharacterized protein YcbK (DUF882 family)
MITMSELLKNTKFEDIPKEHQENLLKLLDMLNLLRRAYGKPLIVSSGYRSMTDHLRIYKEKGITDKSKIPMKSTHLSGMSCDFSDPDGLLKDWVNKNLQIMVDIGFYMEDFSATKTWLHVQFRKPASGKRFFMP